MLLKDIKVKDIARKYTYVSKETPISEAFWKMEATKDTHIIVEEDGIPIGIISIKDFARILSDRLRRKRLAHLFASGLMTSNPITIDGDASLVDAIKLMLEKGISSLLVKMNDGFRILTKRDILSKKDFFKDAKIEELMTKNPITVPMGTKLSRAETLMREKKITVLPVVEEGELIGHVDVRLLSLKLVEIFLKMEEKHPEKIMKEITLEEIMASPLLVTPEESVPIFAEKLIKKGFKGSAIVVSEANPRVIGVLTETDLAKFLLKSD